jgi:mercuric ion transport protein
MENRKLLTTGIVGMVVSTLCCFAPILVVGLGALGLPAAVGRLDSVLFSALAVFAIINIYALPWRRRA